MTALVSEQAPSELVINLKTAHALGLTVPPTLLAAAAEVIGGQSEIAFIFLASVMLRLAPSSWFRPPRRGPQEERPVRRRHLR